MPSAATWVDIRCVTGSRFPAGSSSSLVEEAAGSRAGVLLCASPRIRADRTQHSGIQLLVGDGTLL